LQKTS